jgi:hypothetical protein
MKVVCDPGRHAICFRFGEPTHVWEGPEIRIDGETVGLFVDDDATPSRLKGILFYRHKFYLPFSFVNRFAISDLFVRYSHKDHLVSCDLTYAPSGFESWQVHPGVEVLIQTAAQTGADRPTLVGFRVDTRILDVETVGESLEIDISSDSLK